MHACRSTLEDPTNPAQRSALACIRCGACLNTCPVYRRAGGYAYGTVIPGPIGSVLGPAVGGPHGRELPQASSLCGSCSAVCPVRIDLHGQLLAWRGERRAPSRLERLLVAGAALALRRPALLGPARAAARLVWPRLARRGPHNPAEPWLAERELPPLPPQSFRAQWKERSASGARSQPTRGQASREASEGEGRSGVIGRG